VEAFLTPSNLESLLGGGFDLVLDACDSFRTKVEAIAWCRRRKLPIVTVGAAGGRIDPTQVRVRDLSRTEHDAMLSMIRKKLRGEFNFPKNRDRLDQRVDRTATLGHRLRLVAAVLAGERRQLATGVGQAQVVGVDEGQVADRAARQRLGRPRADAAQPDHRNPRARQPGHGAGAIQPVDAGETFEP
jgi:molybdopterin/thiamine biosynthesis adenylyltransferase